MTLSRTLTDFSLTGDACTSVPKVYIHTLGMAQLLLTIHEALLPPLDARLELFDAMIEQSK